MESKIIDALQTLFTQFTGHAPTYIESLAPSGSPRQYVRLTSDTQSIIGTYSEQIEEFDAFISFSNSFRANGLPVPEIYAVNRDAKVYLQEDFGDESLYQLIHQEKRGVFPEHLIALYKQALAQLARLQIEGGQDIDYTLCYPRDRFDAQSMQWDLQYFKYQFLLPSGVSFEEPLLEQDFQTLIAWLTQAPADFFLFRDFQSRNIMIKDRAPYFIDYQGGRKGPLQYDVVSLLFQAKAAMPNDLRQELLEFYLSEAEQYTPIDRTTFKSFYYGFVLIRSLQVLGAYGFRGLFERKAHFLASIPFALNNVQFLLEEIEYPVEFPHLRKVLEAAVQSDRFKPFDPQKGRTSPLKVLMSSFSFKKGLPQDPTEHGGGFIFDCRFVHNPGRYEPYKALTGADEPVIQFLENGEDMPAYIDRIKSILGPVIERYIDRNFNHLAIHFGCTGGQHRSVYAARIISKWIEDKYGVTVNLHHREQAHLNTGERG